MASLFRVVCFSPSARRRVELCIWADSAGHAKSQVDDCGLTFLEVLRWVVDATDLRPVETDRTQPGSPAEHN